MSSNCANGVLAPNRYNMHGSAKYSTKMLRPGIAVCGRTARLTARYPHNTKAKKGNVMEKMVSMKIIEMK